MPFIHVTAVYILLSHAVFKELVNLIMSSDKISIILFLLFFSPKAISAFASSRLETQQET